MAPDENSLQRMLYDWCTTWKLSINVNKTKVMYFRPQSFARSEFIFQCSENTLDYCESYKYLGVWMDEHLTFNKNAKELVKAASRVLGSLMTKVNIAGGMTYKVYNKLYTSMIEPILMYGSGVW
jgi:hypothetical protein